LPLGSPQFVLSEVNRIVTVALNRSANAIDIICDLAIKNPFYAGLLARMDFILRLPPVHPNHFVIAEEGIKARIPMPEELRRNYCVSGLWTRRIAKCVAHCSNDSCTLYD
jgi:hypothetical protein